MKTALKPIGYKKKPSASVAGNKLVLSLAHALSPVVWQMDLEKSAMSALEVVENEKDKRYGLILKIPGGDNQDIAAFDNREDAVEAMMIASEALENAQGYMAGAAGVAEGPADGRPAPAYYPQKRGMSAGKKLALLGAVVLVVVLFGVWSSQLPRGPQSVSSAGGAGIASGGAAVSPQESSGVPISADDFLRDR